MRSKIVLRTMSNQNIEGIDIEMNLVPFRGKTPKNLEIPTPSYGCSRLSLKRNFKFLLKLLILGLALWMVVDEGLDGNQTRVYFINSMGHNNDTRPFCNETLLMECWFNCSLPSCRKVLNITSLDSANKCEISQLNCKLRLHWAYFACALAAWMLPPVIFAIVLTYAKYQVTNWLATQ